MAWIEFLAKLLTSHLNNIYRVQDLPFATVLCYLWNHTIDFLCERAMVFWKYFQMPFL